VAYILFCVNCAEYWDNITIYMLYKSPSKLLV
jgi:hypothetical protein